MATGDKIFLRFQIRAHALSTGEPRTKPVYNVWDFKRTTTGGTPSKSAAATYFKANILTPLAACLSVSYVTDWLDVRWVDDPLDPYLTSSLSLNGTVTGDSLPSLNNAFMKINSGVRGQSNRGSKHFGPLAESSTLLDELNSGAITLFGTFITAYLAGIAASDGFNYSPFILSEANSTFSPTKAIVNGIVANGCTLNSVLGRMTRRAQFRRGTV